MKIFSFVRAHVSVFCLFAILLTGLGAINFSNKISSAKQNLNSVLNLNIQRKEKLLKTLGAYSALKILADNTEIPRGRIILFLRNNLNVNLGRPPTPGFERFIFRDKGAYEYAGESESVNEYILQNYQILLNPTLPFYDRIKFLNILLENKFVQELLRKTKLFDHLSEQTDLDSLENVNIGEFRRFLASKKYASLIYDLENWESILQIAKSSQLIFSLNADKFMQELITMIYNTDFWRKWSEKISPFRLNNFRPDNWSFAETVKNNLELLNKKPQFLVKKILQTIDLFIASPKVPDADKPFFDSNTPYGQTYRMLWYLENEIEETLADKTISKILKENQSENLSDLQTWIKTRINVPNATSDKFLLAPQLILNEVKKYAFEVAGKNFFTELQKSFTSYSADNSWLSFSNILFGQSTETNSENSNSEVNESLFDYFLEIINLIIFNAISENQEELDKKNKGTMLYFVNTVVESVKSVNFSRAEREPFFDEMVNNIDLVNDDTKNLLVNISTVVLDYLRENYLNKINLLPINIFLSLYEISLVSWHQIVNNEDFWEKIDEKLSSIIKSLTQTEKVLKTRDDGYVTRKYYNIKIKNATIMASSVRDLFNLIAIISSELFGSNHKDTNINFDLIFDLLQRGFEQTGFETQFLNSHLIEILGLFLTKISFSKINDFLQFFLYAGGKLFERIFFLFGVLSRGIKSVVATTSLLASLNNKIYPSNNSDSWWWF